MKDLKDLRVQLSKEEMRKISGGKKVTKTRCFYGDVVDCSDEYDPSKYICHELFTTTNIYNKNIFGGLTLESSTTTSDGPVVDAI